MTMIFLEMMMRHLLEKSRESALLICKGRYLRLFYVKNGEKLGLPVISRSHTAT